MKKLLALVCTFLLAASFAAPSQASGKLVVYCSYPFSLIEPIVKAFEADSGIKVEVLAAGTGELLKRIEAESSNPLGDVIWGGSMSSLVPFRMYFEAYNTPEEAAFIEGVKVPDGKITSFILVPSVLMVNTNLIGNIKVEGYADLLNPALKGKIAHCDPSKSSSSFEHLVNMLYAMGKGDPEKGWGYVDKFAANLGGKLLFGSSDVYKGVANGEYSVGLTYEEDAAKYVSSKSPVKLVYMAEGVISKPDGSAIIKGAKNMDNAKKFIDFISSKPTQTLIATKLNRRSVRDDVPPGEGLFPIEEIRSIKDNADLVAKNKPMWLEKFKDIYTNY